MGAAAKTLAALVVLVIATVAPRIADAERCLGKTAAGESFPICFDTGNRLFIAGGSDGFGGGIRLRHAMKFDDEPDLTWKLEHELLEGTALGFQHQVVGAIYRGRFLRHARDGHLVLPLGLPKKIFLPFDIGAEADFGTVVRENAGDNLELGVVRIAGLLDWSRSPGFGRRLAIGVLGRWDMDVETGDEPSILEHRVMPLSGLTASAALESANGLTLGSVAVEAGRTWSTNTGWEWDARAAIDAERTLIAINDRPLSIQVEAAARLPEREVTFGINVRFALLAKTAR